MYKESLHTYVNNEFLDLETDRYSIAATLITELYMGNIPIGPALFKNISKFKNIIKTEEDQQEYISNMASSILETFPITKRWKNKPINNHSKKFILYTIKKKLKSALDEHIKTMLNKY